jgi:ADP-heptose:LPS heptosyltransferase
MASLRGKLLVDYYAGGLLHTLLKPVVILLGAVLRRNHRLDDFRDDVVFLKLLGGGSVVIAYPSILAFKERGRFKRLRIVVSGGTKGFADLLGCFDEVIVVRDDSLRHLVVDALRAMWRLRRCGVIVDLEPHSRLSAVFCLLTGAVNRVGFYTASSFWRKNLATHLLYLNLSAGIHEFYDQITRLFGVTPLTMDQAVERFRARLGVSNDSTTTGRRVALAPCCSELGRERMLTAEQWRAVVERDLSPSPDAPAHFELLGGPGDRAFLDALAAMLSTLAGVTCTNHAGRTTLRQSIDTIVACGQLWAIDSALLHLARLAGVPTVSFWGPTDPKTRLRPTRVPLDVVHYRPIACSPCVHIASVPPCGGNNVCIRFAVDPAYAGDSSPPWLAECAAPVQMAPPAASQ